MLAIIQINKAFLNIKRCLKDEQTVYLIAKFAAELNHLHAVFIYFGALI